MFDANGTFDSQYESALGYNARPLPPAAMRCMRAASSADHQHAKQLRTSAGGEHNRDHKRRARQLKVQEKHTEARSAELAWEAR